MRDIPIYNGKNIDIANWFEIKRKLEEVYSPIATKVHTISNLHHKQGPNKTLQQFIQNFTNLTEKASGTY